MDGAVWKVIERERESECLVDARKKVLSTGQMPWGKCDYDHSLFISI